MSLARSQDDINREQDQKILKKLENGIMLFDTYDPAKNAHGVLIKLETLLRPYYEEFYSQGRKLPSNFSNNQHLIKLLSEYKIIDVSLEKIKVGSWMQNMGRPGMQGRPDPDREMIIYKYSIEYRDIFGKIYKNELERDREPGKRGQDGYVHWSEHVGVMPSDDKIFKFLTGAFDGVQPIAREKIQQKIKKLELTLQPPNNSFYDQPPNRFKKSKKKYAQKSKTKKSKTKKSKTKSKTKKSKKNKSKTPKRK
jgi:hypothetical protein